MKYLDYTPPEKQTVVINGKHVPVSAAAIKALAQNAMLLATGHRAVRPTPMSPSPTRTLAPTLRQEPRGEEPKF